VALVADLRVEPFRHDVDRAARDPGAPEHVAQRHAAPAHDADRA
jgi:hypothetical protein